jgi:protein O-mannosyl-transferase
VKSARKKSDARDRIQRRGVVQPGAGQTAEWSRWLIPAAVFLLTGLAFLPVLKNGFVNWDDRLNLVTNPHYRGLSLADLGWMFTTFHMSLYRPLTWMTWGLDYLLWGMNPIGYHLTSLIIHALNAVLFYFVALRLIGIAVPGVATSRDFSLRLASGFAALIFAIHPLRVESVAWLSARNDVVSGFFFILTILCYLRAVMVPEGQRGRFAWMAAAVIIYGLSLLSKGIGLMLPVVLLILDIYPLRRLTGEAKSWFRPTLRMIWWEKIPFLALALGAGALAVGAKQKYGLVVPVAEYGLLSRLATAVYGPIFYVGKTILPVRLSPYVPLPIPFDPWAWPFLLSGLAVLIVSGGLFVARHRWPAGLTTWACYATILVPVLGIVQIGPQLVADRYSYLSCLGWAVLAGAGLLYCWELCARQRIGRATFALVGGLAGVALVGFGVLTWGQAKVWRDSETLWRYTLGNGHESSYAHINLGNALAEQGHLEEALEHYRQAVRIDPEDATAYNNIGMALAERGRMEEAIDYYRNALRIDPNHAMAHHNLGLALAERGQKEEAIEQYREALRLNADYASAHNNLGSLLAERGQMEEAIEHYRQALRIDPDYASAHNNLGNALAGQGRTKEAIEHYREALRIDPKLAMAHNNLGNTLAGQGRTKEAIEHYREALRIDPKLAMAHDNLALALAGRNEFEETIEHYREVLRVNPTDAEAHNRLAVALATQGKLDESIKYLRDSLELESSARIRSETHFYLGTVLARQGELGQAREHFEQALKIRPNFVEAQHSLGKVWAAQGNLTKAIEYFREAIRFDPEFAEAHESLGRALVLQGKRDEAAKHYQIAVQLLKSHLKVSDKPPPG